MGLRSRYFGLDKVYTFSKVPNYCYVNYKCENSISQYIRNTILKKINTFVLVISKRFKAF